MEHLLNELLLEIRKVGNVERRANLERIHLGLHEEYQTYLFEDEDTDDDKEESLNIEDDVLGQYQEEDDDEDLELSTPLYDDGSYDED